MATIKIRRGWQYANALIAYIVRLDGEPAGKIRNDEEIELQAGAGSHTMQVEIGWCTSDVVSFSVAADETATFDCGGVGPAAALLYFLFRPSRYLWLRQVGRDDWAQSQSSLD